MSNDFFRFPHTPHIKWLGTNEPRGDKLLSQQEVDILLSEEVCIEEKIDGANIGFSLDEQGKLCVQNRGFYLNSPYQGQFSRLTGWLGQYETLILQHLGFDHIAFGEWCAARHSLGYFTLPDYFLLFDIYDKKEGRFWSAERRNSWAKKVGLKTVPQVEKGQYKVNDLLKILDQLESRYRNGKPEGIIVRKDDEDWNINRGKIVRAEFVQNIGIHWSSKNIVWNHIESVNNTV